MPHAITICDSHAIALARAVECRSADQRGVAREPPGGAGFASCAGCSCEMNASFRKAWATGLRQQKLETDRLQAFFRLNIKFKKWRRNCITGGQLSKIDYCGTDFTILIPLQERIGCSCGVM